MAQSSFEINEKSTKRVLVAALRMRGRYSECCAAFALIASKFAKQVSGKPILLHYDAEFHDDDVDCEVCIPIRAGCATEGIGVRELPECPCVALAHRGQYHDFGQSYARIKEYVQKRGLVVELPIRHVCLDGPASILGGDSGSILTEIQVPITGLAQGFTTRAAQLR